MTLTVNIRSALLICLIDGFARVRLASSWSLKSGLQRWVLSRRMKRIVVPDSEAQNETSIHQFFMDMALTEAQKAGEEGEVPIGALLVRPAPSQTSDRSTQQPTTFEILARAHNRVESDWDASHHAELQAMRLGARRIQNWRLLHTTLYSTLEPCPMCLAASQAFRIERVVYGAPDLRLGAVETHMNLLEVAQHPFHNITTVVRGVREERSAELLREFFRERRKVRHETQNSFKSWQSRLGTLFDLLGRNSTE